MMLSSQFPGRGLQESAFPNTPDELSGTRPTPEHDKKSFACSHCSKGFARRSDLARHGKFDLIHLEVRSN